MQTKHDMLLDVWAAARAVEKGKKKQQRQRRWQRRYVNARDWVVGLFRWEAVELNSNDNSTIV